MRRVCRVVLPLPGIAPLNDEVSPVAVQARTVENLVFGVKIDVAALHHDPVLVVAEKEVLASLVEELALDTVASI